MNRVMHLLISGGYGGIESLVRDYSHRSTHNNIYVFALRGGDVAEHMKSDGINVHILNGSSKRPLLLLKHIQHICKGEHIDTVIVHHDSPLLHFIATCLRKDKGLPIQLITYIHCDPADYMHKGSLIDMLRNRVVINSFKSADKVIAISNYTRKQAVRFWGISDSKISVIYNGIDVNRFENDNNQHDMHEWLYVGRLEPVKGVQIILNALANLPASVDYHLTIVGDGSYRPQLEKLAGDLNLNSNVTFVGAQTKVEEYMKKAGLFIFTPVWEEGFGITVVEAMASGCICVCNRSGALPEIVKNGENGYLLSDDQTETLEDLICRVLNQTDRELEQLRKQAIQDARKYDVSHYVEEVDDYITYNS